MRVHVSALHKEVELQLETKSGRAVCQYSHICNSPMLRVYAMVSELQTNSS